MEVQDMNDEFIHKFKRCLESSNLSLVVWIWSSRYAPCERSVVPAALVLVDDLVDAVTECENAITKELENGPIVFAALLFCFLSKQLLIFLDQLP